MALFVQTFPGQILSVQAASRCSQLCFLNSCWTVLSIVLAWAFTTSARSFMCLFFKDQQHEFCVAVTLVSCCVFNNVHSLWAKFIYYTLLSCPVLSRYLVLYQKVNSRSFKIKSLSVLSEDQIMTLTGLVRSKSCKVGFYPSVRGWRVS